jgi:hypothetical protein
MKHYTRAIETAFENQGGVDGAQQKFSFSF